MILSTSSSIIHSGVEAPAVTPTVAPAGASLEYTTGIAKQAEAERERRAKVIHADGEFQAAGKLTEAADIISRNPQTLQLRFLQTLTEIATEKNSTIIFPLPIEFLDAIQDSPPALWVDPDGGLVHYDHLRLVQQQLDTAQARVTLEDLVRRFPLSGEAHLARERLGETKRR